MKASELILELQKLIKENGDLPVAAFCDHSMVSGVTFVQGSWINDGNDAFEIE